jgi:hypothetical protein
MTRRSPGGVRPGVAGVAAAALACAFACARTETARTEPVANASTANWDAFSGGNDATNTVNTRLVPATPVEITGVPYVRSVKLAWSDSERVPTFAAENQTLRLPAKARQAVLQIAIVEMPSGADVRVDWYRGSELIFSDALARHDDGVHYFALVKRTGKQLDRLPTGEYRAVVRDGATEIKTVRFQIYA